MAALIVVVALVLLKPDPCEQWKEDLSAMGERASELGKASAAGTAASRAEAIALAEDFERLQNNRPLGCN